MALTSCASEILALGVDAGALSAAIAARYSASISRWMPSRSSIFGARCATGPCTSCKSGFTLSGLTLAGAAAVQSSRPSRSTAGRGPVHPRHAAAGPVQQRVETSCHGGICAWSWGARVCGSSSRCARVVPTISRLVDPATKGQRIVDHQQSSGDGPDPARVGQPVQVLKRMRLLVIQSPA